VYVPTGYKPSRPTSLTWILHSLGANFNQYGGLAPTQLEEECQDRDSICATTEGFSDGQWYYGPAEVDFWDVWHQLAGDYDLDPDATVISGYSMGGFASYKLALEYPDLFAQAMPLEGPVVCGERVLGSIETAAGGEQCETDGNTTPLIVNAKWIPYVMTYGALDELVPFTGGVEQVEAFNALGYRYYAVLYPAEDHLVFATQNDFAPATSQLGQLERKQDPGSFTFSWYPDLDSSTLGIGPSGDYWVSGLQARDSAPGQLATVSAASDAIREPQETVEHHTGTADSPTPALTDSLTWTPGATPAARQALTLGLTNVAAATVETLAAKLQCATITATTDGATSLTLAQLRPESAVSENGETVASASSSGNATVELASGTSTLQACSAAAHGAGG
jgi:pimeloyl-ACP methyl ester carboxylesterase